MKISTIIGLDEIHKKLDLIIDRMEAIKGTRYISEELERQINLATKLVKDIDKKVPDKNKPNQGK